MSSQISAGHGSKKYNKNGIQSFVVSVTIALDKCEHMLIYKRNYTCFDIQKEIAPINRRNYTSWLEVLLHMGEGL